MRHTLTEDAILTAFPIHINNDTADEVATLLRAGEDLPLDTTTELLNGFSYDL